MDYYFPIQLLMVYALIGEGIITCTIPIFFYGRKSNTPSISQEEEDNIMKKCLKNPKTNKEFLDFTQRCYCPEDVTFWNAVEQYKVTPARNRPQLFVNMVRTYLVVGAPLELNVRRTAYNIPGIMSVYEGIMDNKEEALMEVKEDIFSELQGGAEHNMVDVFSRFVTENNLSELA